MTNGNNNPPLHTNNKRHQYDKITMALRELVLSCISKAKILKWHVNVGEVIKKENVLATYIFTEKVADTENFIIQRKLKAKFNGKILELNVKPNEEIGKGQIVVRIQEEKCKHDTVMKEMCCDCGADLRRDPGVRGDLIEPANASVPVVHNIPELEVSAAEAERLARYDEQQLLRARKLVLVVDLDMTLIHTTVQPVPADTEDVLHFTLPGHQYEYHTKLRPGARKFLESISKFYELHIFTMGSRMYAHTIAKYLDPEGKFFAHRIRSRDEFINSFSKFHDLKALFPCGDHMVCIIDDREDVWNYAPNLIVVKPYKYFKSTSDINDPFNETLANNSTKLPPTDIKKQDDDSSSNESGDNEKNGDKTDTSSDVSKESEEQKPNTDKIVESDQSITNDKNSLQSDKDNSSKQEDALTQKINNDNNRTATVSGQTDLDDYLFYLDEILERVHFAFYSTLDKVKTTGGSSLQNVEITKYCTYKTIDPDTRVILPELRRQTLKRCNMVFTGVIPTKTPLEKSRAWRTAVSLGARVTTEIILRKNANVDSGLFTTHVVAARHGTHKAHIGYKTSDIQLVNPNWLWCASERWEWPEEGIFPVAFVENKSPVVSRQGTPQNNTTESKTKKQVSPLVKDDFEIPGGYDPDHFLDELNPITSFSKQELDAMDKEVEELMGDDAESESDEENDTALSSKVNPLKRKSETIDDEVGADQTTEEKLRKKLVQNVKKLKRENETDSKYSSSDSSSDDDDDDEEEGEANEFASDSSSSSDSSDDDDDDDDSENRDEESERMASLLERQISEVED